ncbi:DUF268 domain-containing protein [Methylophilus glucosoxydans]|uniref:DUF268 domain-containing protein n=1 Tax=Methylophilus glucosoxydans TaxID=752553 RepID=A0ABW3GMJ4_9PROT
MIKDFLKKLLFSIKPLSYLARYSYNSYLSKKRVKNQFHDFYKLSMDERFDLKWSNRILCLDDNTSNTGFDRHYIYHPAWAARVLVKITPEKHIDVSSTLSFASTISAFINVEFYDFRPANIKLSNLVSKAADLTNLPFENGTISSLSCMHVVEHVGLGRYGDPIDPYGDIKAINELKRVLSYDGNLLFVVPVGKPVIYFNAHRVYSYEQIISYFSDLELVEFALIPENENDGGLNYHANAEDVAMQEYGCGCFWFRKK